MEMEQSYGIAVTNRFLIGDEDDIEDPEEFIKEKTKIEKVKSPSQGKGKKQDPGSNKKKQEIDTKSRKEDPKDSRADSRRGGRGRNNNVANSRPPREGREGRGGGRRQGYTESVEDQENQAPNDLRNDRNERPPRSFGGGRSPRDRDVDRPPRSFGDRFGERPARDADYGDRPPRGRGRGRGGRGRGAGGPEFRRKREFDRHSGSDKSSSFKPQDKREGGGNHNWGSFKDDVKEANTENTANTFTTEDWDAGETHDVKTVPDKVEGEGAGTKEGETPEEEAVEKEPEVQEMTLDEYKALQASSRPKQEFKLRHAGEGENNSQWKKTYLLKKAPPADTEADKEVDQEELGKGEGSKTKDKLDITVHFYDQPTRGGRGGRRGMGGGRGRGRGGRGGGRGGRSRSDEPHISLTDHNQFPSLDGN